MRSNVKRPTKTTQIGVRLDPEVRSRLERAARRESRTVSEFVRLLIEKTLRRAVA